MGMNYKPVILVLWLSLGLISCQPEEEAVAPCEPTPANALFKVYESFERPGTTALLVPTDTVRVNNLACFAADVPRQNSYTWRIGLDTTTRRGEQIRVLFTTVETNLSVLLQTVRQESCSNKTTRDSLRKANAITTRSWNERELEGWYQGSFSITPQDTFSFRVQFRERCVTCDSILFVDYLLPGYRARDGGYVVDYNQDQKGYKKYVNTFAYRNSIDARSNAFWILVRPAANGGLTATILEDLRTIPGPDVPWTKTRTYTLTSTRLR